MALFDENEAQEEGEEMDEGNEGVEAATLSLSAAGFYRAAVRSGVGRSRDPLCLCGRVLPTRDSVGFARPFLCRPGVRSGRAMPAT